MIALETVVDYDKRVQGYKDLEKYAVEHGDAIPLLQSVQALVRKRALQYQHYGGGTILPQAMSWK